MKKKDRKRNKQTERQIEILEDEKKKSVKLLDVQTGKILFTLKVVPLSIAYHQEHKQ